MRIESPMRTIFGSSAAFSGAFVWLQAADVNSRTAASAAKRRRHMRASPGRYETIPADVYCTANGSAATVFRTQRRNEPPRRQERQEEQQKIEGRNPTLALASRCGQAWRPWHLGVPGVLAVRFFFALQRADASNA